MPAWFAACISSLCRVWLPSALIFCGGSCSSLERNTRGRNQGSWHPDSLIPVADSLPESTHVIGKILFSPAAGYEGLNNGTSFWQLWPLDSRLRFVGRVDLLRWTSLTYVCMRGSNRHCISPHLPAPCIPIAGMAFWRDRWTLFNGKFYVGIRNSKQTLIIILV